MTPLVRICNIDKYSILITDITQDSNEYIPEDIVDTEVYHTKNKFKYSETATINIIQKVTTSSEEIIDTIFTDHSTYLDEVHYKFENDGYYVIHHFILPTMDWAEQEIKKNPDLFKQKEFYVCTCNQILKVGKGQVQEVSPEVLIEINTQDTNISKVVLDQFSISFLYNCYISLCSKIFNTINFRCKNKSNIDDLIFNRDFIWMVINIIKYYVELDQLLEAQRLLEEVNFCGGLCNEQGLPKSQDCRCGCNS